LTPTPPHRILQAMRPLLAVLVAAVAALGAAAPAANADFGISSFKADVYKADGTTVETQAGAHPFTGVTSFAFNTTPLGTPDGNVKDVRVDLPPGLVSNPLAIPQCPQASFPSCPADTQLGTETLTTLLGTLPPLPVYNMVPQNGQVSDFAFNAPVFGRSDIIGGLRGTTDYGLYFTISDIPQNANLVASRLEFWGVPADPAHDAARGGPSDAPPTPFLTLPTACAGPQTTTLTADSYNNETATKTATTATGASGCDTLPFSPQLSAVADGNTSMANGAGLTVMLSQPEDQANVHSVSVVLPKELTARGSTVVGACLEQTFQADPTGCASSQVGTVTSSSPLLAGTLDGPVYLVAHPGALPTLEAVLTAPGVLIRLTGSITFTPSLTSTFASVPDLPITRFVLTLPTGPHSALSATKGVCGGPLTMATTITGQNGAQVSKTAPIDVTGCPASRPKGLKLRILRAKVRGSLVALTVKAPRAGRLRATGKYLRSASLKVSRARTVTLKVKLSNAGMKRHKRLHRAHKHLRVHVRVRLGHLVASRFVTFR
jgi:hypothetical protein